MKTLIISFFAFISCFSLFAQTQVGQDIDGESAYDQSGWAVSLSGDGATVAIGAIGNAGDSIDGGHVRVYHYTSPSWDQMGSDINGEAVDDASGWAVSLSRDGSTVAIGAVNNDGTGFSAGHARIFRWSGTDWVQLGADIDGEAGGDLSGRGISLSSDGNTVAIGANHNSGNGTHSGHARIFRFDGASWTQLGADIDGEAMLDESGFALSLNNSGDTIAIGAYKNNNASGADAGHVRIFRFDGADWVQIGASINGEAALDQSGYAVSLSGDGKTVAIGAPFNTNIADDVGHVRVYQFDGAAWTQLGGDIDGEAFDDRFGSSVSISEDGLTVAGGSFLNAGSGAQSGHTRVYRYTGGNWVQLGTDIDGELAADWSGYSVSLSGAGDYVAAGAIQNDGNGNWSGHVRVFYLSPFTSNDAVYESMTDHGITLFPNPVSDHFTVDIEGDQTSCKVHILNSQGQLISESAFHAAKQLSLPFNFTPGIYFAEIITDDGRRAFFRMIKL